ncbi:MAG: hypothetical protein KBS81_11475, partial [Spirochaetales bacterium]|nr:hypothetical protein [Candidatus Physcosoma equi]
MSGSAASCVKDVINRSPFISEMLIQEVISFSNLAQFIKPKVELLYGGEVSSASIVMAIRRYAQDLKKQNHVTTGEGKRIEYELTMKTNIYDVNFTRSNDFICKLPELYSSVHVEQGDFLNVSLGEHETFVSISDKYKGILDDMVKNERVIAREEDMVALTIVFKDDNFLETPGITYLATRKLAWENINIFEIVSTLKVLTFIIKREDSLRAYGVL